MISNSDLVLVCVLPTPRDMEIARLLGWYRIPLRTAPKVIAVDYLAFYQPASFAERSGRIEYVAAVRGYELATRAEIIRDAPDHPRAHEEYYKIQIDALEKIPHPILAEKWKRLTFLFTTGEYLLRARSLNDLVVAADERALLWKSLRERSAQSQAYQAEVPESLDPVILAMLLGIKEENRPYQANPIEEESW